MPLFSTNLYVRPSQNLPLPPKIYPPFQQLYATLPESFPPTQNIPPFHFNNHVRHSQNLPLPPRIYPLNFQQMYMCYPPRIYPYLPEYTPFSTTVLCDSPRIYPSLPEYTPLFNNYMWPSHNTPLLPRIYPLLNKYIIMRRSQNLTLPPRIYHPPPFEQLCATLPESIPPSQKIPPFSSPICDPPKMSTPPFQNIRPYSGRNG